MIRWFKESNIKKQGEKPCFQNTMLCLSRLSQSQYTSVQLNHTITSRKDTMRYRLITHYELVELVKENKKSPTRILEVIRKRVEDNTESARLIAEHAISDRFRMLEAISAGNAIRRSAKRYTT